MASTKAVSIVNQFVGCVNRRDIHGLAKLMDEGYRFVGADGGLERGRQAGLINWTEFLSRYPDYRQVLESVDVRGDEVVAIGRVECSDRSLDGPALFIAEVLGSKVSLWRMYDDTPANRGALGIEE